MVTLRAVVESDAREIFQAFDRLSDESRYARFQHHKKSLDPDLVERRVRPQAGQEFVFVATVPATDGIDIVGAAQYLNSAAGGASGTCEFAVTVADDWRGSGLATELLRSLVRRARHDRYELIEGFVLADNRPMLALARRLRLSFAPQPDEGNVVRVWRALR